MTRGHYNIRVYAIILNDQDEILLSDERRNGHSFTKFPGGGMEWGEGMKDCLKRELEEEMGLSAIVGELLYVNDFFQKSAFRDTDQLISFYYLIDEINFEAIKCWEHPIPMVDDGEAFRWVKRSELTQEMVTFPVDSIVVSLLREGNSQKV
ncbi:MAG: 8-oxo-dGTP diphosphatase [Flavobacteriaceae bacterium]|jgi:8-oxo-dGTP diphosphatase